MQGLFEFLLQQLKRLFPGMERELGNKTHDGAIRGGQHHILRAVRRLQGGARIHRRLHIPLHAIQGCKPDVGRGIIPQTHWRLDVSVGIVIVAGVQ